MPKVEKCPECGEEDFYLSQPVGGYSLTKWIKAEVFTLTCEECGETVEYHPRTGRIVARKEE